VEVGKKERRERLTRRQMISTNDSESQVFTDKHALMFQHIEGTSHVTIWLCKSEVHGIIVGSSPRFAPLGGRETDDYLKPQPLYLAN
jgi:hypothetical protein